MATNLFERIAPYMEELLENDQLQDNLTRSVTRARQAYGGARSDKNLRKVARDRRVRGRARQSALSARDAIATLRDSPQRERRRRRRQRVRRMAMLAAGVAMVGRARSRGWNMGPAAGTSTPASSSRI